MARAANCRIAAISLMFSSIAAHAFLPASERDVLVAIYNSTGGPNWTNHTGWNGKPRTECGWYGVQCDDTNDHVIRLVLGGNNLTGSLPATISGLPSLIQFSADHNQLTGPMPVFSDLPLLHNLDLENNQLTGPITDLRGPPDLAYVYVNDNQLTALSPVAGMTALVDFSASRNALTGPIPALSNLPSLSGFFVQQNQLSGSLPSLSNLPSLTSIWIDHNLLTGALPLTPFPDSLLLGKSSLCPNRLDVRDDPAWDFATGQNPWWLGCDRIFADSFGS